MAEEATVPKDHVKQKRLVFERSTSFAALENFVDKNNRSVDITPGGSPIRNFRRSIHVEVLGPPGKQPTNPATTGLSSSKASLASVKKTPSLSNLSTNDLGTQLQLMSLQEQLEVAIKEKENLRYELEKLKSDLKNPQSPLVRRLVQEVINKELYSEQKFSQSFEELADDMQSLISKQTQIEKELENTIRHNIDLSTKVERMSVQLEVYQEEKKRRYSDGSPAPTGDVTLVFTDVQGSTRQWESDASTMAQALQLHNEIIRSSIGKYSGYEVKTEGDAFMIAFPSPIKAMKFCLETQQQLMEAPWPTKLFNSTEAAIFENDGICIYRGLRVRMGVHTGCPTPEIDPVTGRMDYFGPMVNRSARVVGIAQGGQILITGSVWDKIKDLLHQLGDPDCIDLGDHKLRGLETNTKLVQVLPKKLSKRTFCLPRPSVTGELVSESELLRQNNLALIRRLEEVKVQFCSLKSTADQLMTKVKNMEIPDDSNLYAVKEIEKLMRGQNLLQEKIEKVEQRNEFLRTRVSDLTNSTTTSPSTERKQSGDTTPTDNPEVFSSDSIYRAINQICSEEPVTQENAPATVLSSPQSLGSTELIKELSDFATEKQELEKQLIQAKQENMETLQLLEEQKKLVSSLNEEVQSSKSELEGSKNKFSTLKSESHAIQKKILSELASLQKDRLDVIDQLMNLKIEVKKTKLQQQQFQLQQLQQQRMQQEQQLSKITKSPSDHNNSSKKKQRDIRAMSLVV